jgi:phage FluMu protein Com
MSENQARNKATVDKHNWVRCVTCGHKLGKIVKYEEKGCLIEIKCHSCKTINLCYISKED